MKLERKIKFASSFDEHLVYYDFEISENNTAKDKDQSENAKQTREIKPLVRLVNKFVMMRNHNYWTKK